MIADHFTLAGSQVRIIRFDEQPVPRATLDDLQPKLWERFATRRSRDGRDDLLVKLAMARLDEDGVLRPTVAGVLMASEDPCRWLPNTMTVESLPYRQAARNEAITSLLAKCSAPETDAGIVTNRGTFMDKRGEGVQIILDNSERISGRRPEYRIIDDSELMLTIYAAGDA